MAKFMEAGKKLAEQKDYRAAILQFRSASQAMPKKAEPYFQTGLAYLALQDWANAIPSLRRALALDPKHTGAQLALAELEASTTDRPTVELAQKQLQELLTTAPDNPEVLTTLALTEWKLAKPEEAEEHLNEAFERFPNDLMAAGSLAKVKMSKGDFAGAEEALKRTANQVPPSANAVALLGAFYAVRKNDAEAEAQFRRALQTDPKCIAALFYSAELQVRQGKKDQAEQTYQQISKLDSHYRFIYGAFLLQAGKPDAAVAEIQRLWAANPKDREVRNRLVAVLFAAHRSPEAEKLLSEAIKNNSKDVDAKLQRSRLYIDSHQYSQARRDLEEALRNQNSAEVQYLLAKVDEAEGNLPGRMDHLNEAVRLRPSFLRARLELSNLLVQSNGGKSALGLMDQTPRDQKDLPEAIATRNWALIATGQGAAARAAAETAIVHSRIPDLLLQEGIFKTADKQYDEARRLLREGLAQSPDSRNFLIAIVQTYAAQNQVPAGVKEIQAYASQRPGSAPVQTFLGEVLMQTGDRVGANAAFAAAKAADSKNIQADLQVALLYQTEGRPDDAIRMLGTVLSADPSNKTALLWRGNVEESKGDHSAAVADYRHLLERDSENKDALNNLSFLLAEYLHQPDEALKYAEKALELNPSDPATQDTLGWVLYRKGLYELSVKQLEAAARHPGDPRWQYHLAMAYAKAGQPSKAKVTFDAANRVNANLPEAKEAKELLAQATSQK
jgi:putative PEP-CTERM system TPR-repeat lipoprotein